MYTASAPRRVFLVCLLLSTMILSVHDSPRTNAAPFAADPFQRTWMRTDGPVASGAVSRTWMWGEEAFSAGVYEDYADSPNGRRLVQYHDKSRMEITNPGAVDDGLWYVTNGLIAKEMITGEMQVGHAEFVQRAPALVNVAGDPNDTEGPTYAAFRLHVGQGWGERQGPILRRIHRDGTNEWVPDLAKYNVGSAAFADDTGHWIAEPFWEFMTSSGLVHENGQNVHAPLFQNAFYATGLPITDAQWARVKVGGTVKDVLVQCFERRCLTYTPDNPPGWQVEAGNVGQHYFRWRYGQIDVADGPSTLANTLARKVRHAPNDTARYEALLEVFDHLSIGVYTTDGRAIVRGAERGWNDFYLYDFQVRALSESLERGTTYTVAELAMQLTALELLPEGEIIEPQLMLEVIRSATAKAAQRSNDPVALVPLLVRQLGLYALEPYDLMSNVALEKVQLDTLAYYLLLLDSTLPLIADQLPLANASPAMLIENSSGILKPAAAASTNPCEIPGGAKTSWGLGLTAADLAQKLPKVASLGLVVISGLHGSALAFSVRVSMLNDPDIDTRHTHYGPAEHEMLAGKELVFRLFVEMRDEYPDLLIECGWIAGVDIPRKGGIPEVSVHWFWPGLGRHGTVNCGNACPSAAESGVSLLATNNDGIATLVFRPKDEKHPGEGMKIEANGVVTGVALYQSKFWNVLGAFAQYLIPKYDTARWFVSYHETPGWDVEAKVTYNVTSTEGEVWNNATGTLNYTFRIDADKLVEVNDGRFGGQVDFTASGNGSWSTHGNCSGSWTGSWARQTALEILDRDQNLAKVIGYIGPDVGNTTHPWQPGECNVGQDIGVWIVQGLVTGYPSFSLNVHTKQTRNVNAASLRSDLSGTITWEFTVKPMGS
jgi:hypothetical protein